MRRNWILSSFGGLLFSATVATSSQAATYDIGWTGSNGYTLDGSFSFDDSLLGTGAIDESDITALSFEVLLNGISQGIATLASFTSSTTFNFNFDTITEMFVTGGLSAGTSGQSWNNGGVPVGFTSGSGAQAVSVGNSFLLGQIPVGQSTLDAVRADITAAVPLPAGFPLLIGALGLLGLMRRKA